VARLAAAERGELRLPLPLMRGPGGFKDPREEVAAAVADVFAAFHRRPGPAFGVFRGVRRPEVPRRAGRRAQLGPGCLLSRVSGLLHNPVYAARTCSAVTAPRQQVDARRRRAHAPRPWPAASGTPDRDHHEGYDYLGMTTGDRSEDAASQTSAGHARARGQLLWRDGGEQLLRDGVVDGGCAGVLHPGVACPSDRARQV